MLLQMQNVICQYVEIDPEEITGETKFVEDLKLNSFDVVSLVSALEEEFDVVIEDRDILNFVTVSDVMEYIDGKLS